MYVKNALFSLIEYSFMFKMCIYLFFNSKATSFKQENVSYQGASYSTDMMVKTKDDPIVTNEFQHISFEGVYYIGIQV